MPLEYDEGMTSSRSGIPNGALTVLIIAAIAIVSVVITLFCMLVNNRRSARLRQRTQQRNPPSIMRLSTASALATPADTPRPANYPPMYICSSFDPKFDAPPSYEDAVRAMVQTNSGNVEQLAAPVPQRVTTIAMPPESTNESDAAQIEVEMTHAPLPTTSNSL